MVAQAQQSNADTALPDYLRDLPHYNLPGLPDSILSKKMEYYVNDSTHQSHELVPPQRQHYFLYKPDPKRAYFPGEYKMRLNDYYKNLRQFKKDSIEFLQYKHIMDSLDHQIDNLRRMSKPTLVYQVKPAGYTASNEAIFALHSFSAIACNFVTRLISRPSSSAVMV
jgi:hypothetical protein